MTVTGRFLDDHGTIHYKGNSKLVKIRDKWKFELTEQRFQLLLTEQNQSLDIVPTINSILTLTTKLQLFKKKNAENTSERMSSTMSSLQ